MESLKPASGLPTSREDFQPRQLLNPALAIPTAGVVISEGALYFGSMTIALWGHLLTLLFCAVGALWISDQPLLQAFALVPLFRLVNLGMPIFVELTLLWFPLIYGPVVPAMILVSRNPRIPDVSWGLRTGLLLAPLAIVFAGALAEVEYAIIEPDALIRSLSIPNVALLSVVMLCFVGLVEEYVYRGVLQRIVQERLGSLAGLVLVSALFGLMHSAYQTPGELLFAAAIGLLFGLIYDTTDSMVLIVVAHGALNVFLFGIIPLNLEIPGVPF